MTKVWYSLIVAQGSVSLARGFVPVEAIDRETVAI